MTSAMTDAELRAMYEDNSDYDLAESPAKARLFIKACRAILMRFAGKSGIGDVGLDLGRNLEAVQQQHDRATAWLALNDTNRSKVTYASLRGMRR